MAVGVLRHGQGKARTRAKLSVAGFQASLDLALLAPESAGTFTKLKLSVVGGTDEDLDIERGGDEADRR